MLFYVSPIHSSLQHSERRRKPQAVHWEVLRAAGVCPSPGTTRASPLGGPLRQRDVRINQGSSSMGAHRQIHRDLARHPRPQPQQGTVGLGWGRDSPCPSSWLGRGGWLGTFWTRRDWQGWSCAAVGYPTILRSRVPLPAPVPATAPVFPPQSWKTSTSAGSRCPAWRPSISSPPPRR